MRDVDCTRKMTEIKLCPSSYIQHLDFTRIDHGGCFRCVNLSETTHPLDTVGVFLNIRRINPAPDPIQSDTDEVSDNFFKMPDCAAGP